MHNLLPKPVRIWLLQRASRRIALNWTRTERRGRDFTRFLIALVIIGLSLAAAFGQIWGFGF